MPRRVKVREKYWDEKNPNKDLDLVEVFMTSKTLDTFLYKPSEQSDDDETNYLKNILIDRKRREQLLEQIYQAASDCLTDRQFQIFVLRYRGGCLEKDIATQVGVIQPYVSNTLKVCHKKIRRFLKLEMKAKRKQKKSKKTAKTSVESSS